MVRRELKVLSFNSGFSIRHALPVAILAQAGPRGPAQTNSYREATRLEKTQTGCKAISMDFMSRGPTGPLITFPSWTRPSVLFSNGF